MTALLLAVALAAAGAGALYGAVPGAGDAPARVERILRAHGGTPLPVAPSARVARAIVAVEDERFFEHGAIDPIAIARVIATTLRGGPADPGGSTIAQQLAKTLYVRAPGSLGGSLEAIALAYKLERRWSKPRILSMYLNAIYFGHGFYGVRQAARGYFSRSPDRLSWQQASLLAGLPQAPSAYDPLRHPAAARARQRQVLRQLVRRGVLTTGQAARVSRQPLRLRPAG